MNLFLIGNNYLRILGKIETNILKLINELKANFTVKNVNV